MTGRHQNRRGEGAQSVVETALVLPFLIVLALGFAGAIFVLDATTELRSATGLATSAAFSVPYGATSQALFNINDTFQRSVSGPFLEPGSLRITCPTYEPDTVVSCRGTVTVSFSNNLIGLVWRWNVTLQQNAQLVAPPFRQCAPSVTC